MKKMKDHSAQVLNLQEIHEEEQEQKTKKNRILPLILLTLGLVFITIGFFYKDIAGLMGKKKEEKKPQTIVSDPNKLKCNYKNEDTSLGVSYLYSNSYTFSDRKLKSSQFQVIISALKNSDIATSNLKVLHGKYSDVINTINQVNGVEATTKLKDNQLRIEYHIDFSLLDPKQFPQNDKIALSNTLDEEYSSIKRKNQERGYLCE